MMRNQRNRKGFTLAEMMIVVAIVVILAALIGIAIARYQRRLHQMEMDGHAKELFVVAQNNLTTAKSQGYLGYVGEQAFGKNLKPDVVNALYGVAADDVYYFIVNGGSGSTSLNDKTSLLSAMLPPGSLDDTLRANGSYVIVYQQSSGTVLDVFYASGQGSRFGYDFSSADMPAGQALNLMGYAGDAQESARAKYNGGSSNIIGWFGDAEPTVPVQTVEQKNKPLLRVYNGETLLALVFPENADGAVELELVGAESKNKKTVKFTSLNLNDLELYDDLITEGREAELIGKKCYPVVLDDITQENKSFASQFAVGTGPLIPGEDIRLTATVKDGDNTLSSPTYRTNSLFAYNRDDNDKAQKTAKIGCFRHLENLDQAVSGFRVSGTGWSYQIPSGVDAGRVEAVQIADLNWDWHGSGNRRIYYGSGDKTGEGYYYPLCPEYALAYDGDGHSITGVVTADLGGGAGLFGTLEDSGVKNLQLVDFAVSGGNAGALAGILKDSEAVNVAAYHSSGREANKITAAAANGNAGGLIGSAKGATVTKCAAALCVEANAAGGNAGGLIGKAENTTLRACYSGGHTKNGQYYDKTSNTYIYNIKAATAGGLIGSADGGTANNCYSTCSVQGTTAAGGFVGSVTGGSISSCYATGLVHGTVTSGDNLTKCGAFAGRLSGTTVSGGKYFMIINEILTNDAAAYLPPVGFGSGSGIEPLDKDTAAYNTFVGSPSDWREAKPYDGMLYTYYHDSSSHSRYSLGTLGQLGSDVSEGDFAATHYGDWPAPETWVFNK